MKTYIIDTYAWISYFEGKKEFKSAIEENELYTPSIVLAEISRILARKKVPREKSAKILGFIKKRSLILSLDETNAVEAGKIADKEGLYLIDGIIYSYVNENMRLLTGDMHFRNKPYVDFIEHKNEFRSKDTSGFSNMIMFSIPQASASLSSFQSLLLQK